MTPQEEAEFQAFAAKELGAQAASPRSSSMSPQQIGDLNKMAASAYGGVDASLEKGGAYGGVDTAMSHDETPKGPSDGSGAPSGLGGMLGAAGKSLMSPQHQQSYNAIFGHSPSATPKAGATMTPQEEAELNKMAMASGVQMSDRRVKTSIRSGEGDTQELLERLAANGWIGRAK